MYFETGQGSELSSSAAFGSDQQTMECRCYGLARHYHPFLVNTVVGFMGPEYIYDTKQLTRAALEDVFCGHLHGLPMGCDVCYTNHMPTDQNDSETILTLLGTAGVHYVMGLPQADDIMLMYQSTSYHDVASIRQLLKKLQQAKTHVAVVTKANIMKKTDGKFTAICHEVAADYPGITVDDYYIDIMTANLLKEPLREQFQVVLLPNLYGDIITDEAAQIQGGVGTAGSANVGDRYAMFEAIHGSAPRMIERGMGDYANPASIIKAAAMLLRHICRADAAARLEKAMAECKVEVKSDGTAATAAQYADAVMALL